MALSDHIQEITKARRAELALIEEAHARALKEAGGALIALRGAARAAGAHNVDVAFSVDKGPTPTDRVISQRLEAWITLRRGDQVVRLTRARFTGEAWASGTSKFLTLAALIGAFYESDPAKRADEILAFA